MFRGREYRIKLCFYGWSMVILATPGQGSQKNLHDLWTHFYTIKSCAISIFMVSLTAGITCGPSWELVLLHPLLLPPLLPHGLVGAHPEAQREFSTKFWIYVFPVKELRGLSPYLHIHVCFDPSRPIFYRKRTVSQRKRENAGKHLCRTMCLWAIYLFPAQVWSTYFPAAE